MRKPKIDMSIFKKRREALTGSIANGALILAAHPDYIRNNDVHHAYRQDSNLYYLTGFEEPEAIFVFRPGKTPESVMFVREKDMERETWDGFRYGPEGVMAEFHIDEAFNMDEFYEKMPNLLKDVDKIYYNFFRHAEYDQKIQDVILDTKSLVRRSGQGNLPIEDSFQILGEMRLFKSDYEIETMKRAGKISCKAHLEVMKAIKPGINERALYGVFLKSILEQGCSREAYKGIFASGDNATTLHYDFNDQVCRDGELFLIDAGGELDYYSSDITRTYPVNGKFNADQKRIYQSVLDLQKKLVAMVKPGLSLHAMQKLAIESLTTLMVEEKLLTGSVEKNIQEKNFIKYYPHGVGHWLGLDVHDAGLSSIGAEPRRFEPGMVFTVEPGIYIPADDKSAPEALRGIGIRIEDNVLVTADGNEVFTSDAPKEVDELEAVIGR